MKKSIFALIMALILCMTTVPAEVMAAEYSGSALKSAENVFGRYRAGGFGTLAGYMSDTSVKEIPADDIVPAKGKEAAEVSSTAGDKDQGSASFNPYVFEISENGENARVKLEPDLMGSSLDAKKSSALSGNGTWGYGNDTVDLSGYNNNTGAEGDTSQSIEYLVDNFYVNASHVYVDLKWMSYDVNLSDISDYKLKMLVGVNDSKALINLTDVLNREYASPEMGDVLLFDIIENNTAVLKGISIPLLESGQAQFNDTDDGLIANGIKYGDEVTFKLTPVVIAGNQTVKAGEEGASFTLLGDELPPEPGRAVYNLNDSLRMDFETVDLDSQYYEVVGLSEQNPGGDREAIDLNGTSYYIFGKSTIGRNDAVISNVTKEGGVLANNVYFNATLSNVQFNSTGILPAIGERVYFSVRSEKSGFGDPLADTVGCEVPYLNSTSLINQTATVDFITRDVQSSYFDVYGFVKNEEGGAIHISNSTYSEFGMFRCNSKDAEFLINSTDEKGNLVSEISISAPTFQFNETAEPVKPGDTLYFAVGTEHGRDPEKAFDGDLQTAELSNLIETVAEKLTPVITAHDITKTAKTKDQSFDLEASTNGGELTFNSSSAKVTVDPDGRVTVKKNFIGKAVITVNSPETEEYKSGSKDVTITVKPPKAALKKVKNIKKRKVKANWKKSPVTTITGYQIRYSTSKKFAKSKTTTKTIKGRKKTSAVISRLKKGKKYYFQIRTYKKTSDGKYYSGWSKSKAVKIKK